VRDAEAVVVLGCKVSLDEAGRLLPGALRRRLEVAARVYAERGCAETVVIASGGRRWGGHVEADVMARELAALGVPGRAIVRERCSFSTRENARFVAEALARRGAPKAVLVTCDWHMPRAAALFAQTGTALEVAVAADGAAAPWTRRLWRTARERLLSTVATFLHAAALMALGALAGCSRGPPTLSLPADASPGTAPEDPLLVVRRAEDTRRAEDIPADLQRNHEPSLRRAAARARARILDADDAPLLRALEDEDDEVVSWASYGLGESCKGREATHVGALAARLSSSRRGRPSQQVMLRALGRCGGEASDQTLRAWLRKGGDGAESAAYALGDVAALRGSLSLESSAALLDAVQGSPPLAAAFYPFGRTDAGAGEDLGPRLVAAARGALGHPDPTRIFAVRALGRSGESDAATDLARVLDAGDFSRPERAEAAHGLSRLHKAGQAALADAIATLVPERAEGLMGDGFGTLMAALEAVGDDPPKKTAAALWAIARIDPPEGAPPALLRRASAVRCAAAAKLARGAWDSDVLRSCDVSDGEAGDRARLAALDREPLARARRAAWVDLSRSNHTRVREGALDLIARHPELGDKARSALAEAFAASEPGIVAVAASVVQAHPDRVFVLARSERLAALDPSAPAPSASPARELDPSVAKAIRVAIGHRWSPDQVETRAALVDAALAVGLEEARGYAREACKDPNTTMRARASKALASAGEKDASCPPPDGPGEAAPEIGHPLVRAVRVVFDTDAGVLSVRFDPAVAPLAVTRLVALARSGFYTHIEVHRVVPGFVVQFGDRGGDGYGGSGDLLRCETAPAPFARLDVGVALAGRDTGSSQIFVTLARYPHLDGEYPWVGRAEGDWDAIAEGDVVRAVRVEE
jgi:cyclophilin family peptidyl-prolyl cis-trans isomerase